MIPYGRQSLDEDDIRAVVETLKSDYLTQGPKVEAFESAVASYCSAKHAVAVNSATSALHIACLALGIGKESLVWTSPISFTASANCARYCGAEIDFVDVDMGSGNISIERLRKKLADARVNNAVPDLLIAVHFSGQPCNMAAIGKLADEYGFSVIEDAAHAIGSSFEGHKTGACRHSDITVFSFHPVKIITSAEGGMALTNSGQLAQQMRLLSSHGITKDTALMSGEPDGPWAYHQLSLGFNYRISDLHAALGLSQLSKLEPFVEQRNAIAKRYDDAFSGLPVRGLKVAENTRSSYHLYTLLLDPAMDRRQIYDTLQARGLGVNVHYIPIYKQPYYQDLGFAFDYCPAAEEFYHSLITLPLYPAMSAKEVGQVIDIVTQTVTQALSNDSVVVTRNPGDY